MQLHELNVYKNRQLVRSVPFKDGLNIITNIDCVNTNSGNSVGKSTPSRLLDYLFLASGEDIYTDSEFNKKIPEVANFIEDNEILVELKFLGFDKKNHTISRTLETEPKKCSFFVNGEPEDKKKYTEFVSLQVFGLKGNKPSIRNVSHKFIRNTNDKMQNTTRFLHGNTKPDVYDQVYLFLFGFEGMHLLKEKAKINNQLATKRRHLAAYRNPHKESALLKMIKPLDAEKKELKEKIAVFDFKDSQKGDVKELVSIQGDISDITVEYSSVENKISYLTKSIDKIKKKATRIDGKELTEIYADAGVLLGQKLKRSYEDLVVFHNKVLLNKVSLISKELSRFTDKSVELKARINELQSMETEIFNRIKEPDVLKSIGQMYNELASIREQIAKVKALLEKIENAKIEIESLESTKDEIVTKINNNTEQLDNNIELFNTFFGQLSKFFYDERYIFDIEFNSEKEKCEFDIACITPNATGGKKKGELSAFDLAYIEFVNKKKLKRPTFVFHDSIEDVYINQVFDIFQQANKIEGQYIIAILRDKISDEKFEVFRRDSIILELSEDEKFFKI